MNDTAGAGNVTLASAELYDPATRSWTATGSMTRAHFGHTATLLPDGRVLVVDSIGGVMPSAELYDPRSGTWTATASLVLAHEYHVATLLANGSVLVVGGPPGSMVRATPAEVYDPRSGSWTAVASMNVGRFAPTLTPLLDGTALAIGGVRVGQDPVTERAAERYDPASRSWTYTGDMLERHIGHAATLLPDGSVLVTGGILLTGGYGDTIDPTNTAAESYDPDTNSWSAAGRLIEVRRGHTATLLPGGTVLMIGYQLLALPELFDPASGSSTTTGRMVEPRSNLHTATLLLDGTVLVTGGAGSGCCSLASTELFHPTSHP